MYSFFIGVNKGSLKGLNIIRHAINTCLIISAQIMQRFIQRWDERYIQEFDL
jgi:hypothetical protein